MRRLGGIAGLVLVLVTACGSAAYASCAPGPLTRTQSLERIRAGHSGFAVAFVGTVARREQALRLRGVVYTPVLFTVKRSFAGSLPRRETVLVDGGCINGSCVADSEALDYGHGPQLVLATRDGHGHVISASDCSDAGPLTAAEFRFLMAPARPATGGGGHFRPDLPYTGTPSSRLLAVGAGCLLLGATALGLGRAAPRAARRLEFGAHHPMSEGHDD